MQQKAATKKSLTTKGTKNTEHKGHKEKLTKKRGFYRVILYNNMKHETRDTKLAHNHELSAISHQPDALV